MTATPAPLSPAQGLLVGSWRLVAGLLLIAELIKHALFLAAGSHQPWGDSGLYWELGSAIAQGDWWLTENPIAFRTPGYPWWLGLCQLALGRWGLFAVQLSQHVCVVATTLIVVHFVWIVSRARGWAFLAWGACLLSTARPLYANWLLTESLATLLLTVSVWVIARAILARQPRWLILAGFVLGCGVLVKPSLVAGVPALLLAGLWLSRAESHSSRERLGFLLAGPLVFAATITPWCLRNQQLFDRFTLCVFTGREMWTAHFSPWPGGALELPQDGIATELWQRVGPDPLDERHQWSVSHRLRDSGLNDAETDILMEQVATLAISRQPRQALSRTLARCGTFWYCWEWETDLNVDDPAFAHSLNSEMKVDPIRPGSITVREGVARCLRYTPERWRISSVAWCVLAWISVCRLAGRAETRRIGWLLIATWGTTTLLTAALEIPLYRYRCVLEPLMIVAICSACSLRQRASAPGL